MKIVGIGEVVWDCFPEEKTLGGAPINFCFFAKELGANSFPVTSIGKDSLGDETIAALETSGLNLQYITRNDLPTGRVLVTLDDKGIPQYEIVENVAWDTILCDSKTESLTSDADVVCWGSLAQRSPESKDAILRIIDSAPASALKVFDINIRQNFYSKDLVVDSLNRANILKLNEDELPLLISLLSLSHQPDVAISELIDKFSLKYVIYTQGAICSSIYDETGEVSNIKTPRVKVVDTVGAGDSFTAAFVVSMLKGKSISDSHKKAVEVSAYTCTQKGAIKPLPATIKKI